MKRKIYLRVSIIFFLLSFFVLLYGLSLTGLFEKNTFVVRALACDTCASYQVVLGSFKFSQDVPDTIQNKNTSQVFLAGMNNPFGEDYTKTYDYYLVKGTVSGMRQVNVHEAWNPVLNVTSWEHIYLGIIWPFLLVIIFLLVMGFRFYRRYLNANKVSVLKNSLRAHEQGPDL